MDDRVRGVVDMDGGVGIDREGTVGEWGMIWRGRVVDDYG